jgi:DNA-binding FadR family transcriptional regulator
VFSVICAILEGMTDRYSTEAAAGSHINASSAAQDEASLHDRLLEEWGSDIAAGRIGAGERLPQPSAELGVPSRTVTREVTRVLESKGMVNVRRKTGAIVTPSAQWNPYDRQIIRWRLKGPERLATLHELSQLRVAVEPAAAFLAAQNATPSDWARLTQATMDMVAYSNHANESEYLQADIMFHRTLLTATGNRMFAALDGIIVATLEGRTEHQLMPSIANADALRRHTDVAAFIRKGDGIAARKAMEDIVNESDEAMTQMTGGE